jgi:hypothetical protein
VSRSTTLLSLGAVVVVVGLASLVATGAIKRALPSPRPIATVLPTPSAIPISIPTASGGLVPSQLWGNWYLPGAAVTQVSDAQCPSPPTPRTCFFQLALDATTWSISYIATGGIVVPHQGDVVVNGDEMEFFNDIHQGNYCSPLYNGIGRFTWRVTAGVLYFKLISDDCDRAHVLTNRGWIRTLAAGQPGG